ncbi:MAG: NAD-dependent epimerase/dehydratase family protein [Brevundimonas sp.]|uniref:NAD-dependent epimerase/dehydratase family protein n=1 Tax=Brevundimonas sp. TaxID=1871086 RepID=UPI00391A6C50
MTIIVTGAAGFIGMHVAESLLTRGEAVIGVDNFTDYYDPALKVARAARLEAQPGFRMVRADVADHQTFADLVRTSGADRIIHLAAQAGVRYSLENPFAYEHSNLAGQLSVLEAARHSPGLTHLVYASSSSVYGDQPVGGGGLSEVDAAMAPVSLYAATKRSAELMSHAYAGLYALPLTGLRFFTVYGPWGRPDMAYYGFTRAILSGEPIQVYGQGQMARDFTYVDDIVNGVIGALDRPPAPGENRILNIGDDRPVGLMEMIATLERLLGREAVKVMKPMQPGDVTATHADISRLNALTGYRPRVMLEEGLARFVDWYRDFEAAGD